MTKEEIVRKCAKQAGFVIGQHGYGMIEHAVNLAWDAALASRSDVPRQQIACVVILDYDYEGDALAGVHHGGCGAAGQMGA